MDIDETTVRRIAKLARIAVTDEETDRFSRELSGILDWVAELDEIDTAKVAPMTGIGASQLSARPDEVTDGERAADIMKNAPKAEDNFFLVPKVIE